jgi:prephenate dehydrogenase
VREHPPTLIVGSGLIGASIGLALRRVGQVPWLADRDPEAVTVAARRGAGQPWPEPASGTSMPAVGLVVVAVPPMTTAQVVAAALAEHPEAVVTDVASVKAPVLRALAGNPGLDRYVGSHPMAGREVSGPGAARADLFDDRPWVISTHPGNTGRALSAVRALVQATRALPIELEPAAHDRAVALISHVPQVVSSLLAAQLVGAPEDAVAIAGQGLRDMTRIAASDPGLWTQILTANRGPIAEVLGGLRADLDMVLAALQGAQPGPVTTALLAGNAGRKRVPGKHGTAAEETVVLPVLVSDRPGELSRLFAAVDAAGVNVEDARIEHVLGRPTGVVELSVPARHGPRLANNLRSAGWSVRG